MEHGKQRGHNSHNGVISAAVNSKILDVEMLTKICKQCTTWEEKKSVKWKENHHLKCPINHTKSTGAMEGNGAVKIFQRSVEKRTLIYKEVVDTEPYKEFTVVSVKKRMCRTYSETCGEKITCPHKNIMEQKLQLVIEVN